MPKLDDVRVSTSWKRFYKQTKVPSPSRSLGNIAASLSLSDIHLAGTPLLCVYIIPIYTYLASKCKILLKIFNLYARFEY